TPCHHILPCIHTTVQAGAVLQIHFLASSREKRGPSFDAKVHNLSKNKQVLQQLLENCNSYVIDNISEKLMPSVKPPSQRVLRKSSLLPAPPCLHSSR